MHASFRERFEARGEALNLMGDAVRDMSREELYAVIGFLLDASDIDEIETQLGRYAPAHHSRNAGEISAEPSSNNGLFEG